MMTPLISKQSLTDICIFWLFVFSLGIVIDYVNGLHKRDVFGSRGREYFLQEDVVYTCAFTNLELSRFVH